MTTQQVLGEINTPTEGSESVVHQSRLIVSRQRVLHPDQKPVVCIPSYGGDVCVTEADGSWAQCVDCDTSQFQQDCVKWDTDLRAGNKR